MRITRRRLQLARFWRVMWLLALCLHVLTLGAWSLRSSVRLWSQMPGWDPDDWFAFAVLLCLTVAAWHASISAKRRLQTLRQTTDLDATAMNDAGSQT
jgi:hypothetical protein